MKQKDVKPAGNPRFAKARTVRSANKKRDPSQSPVSVRR